jgi:ADP-ribose pyrophosphatase YjhB (NUDIX family)
MSETQISKPEIYTSFLIPVIEGKIYLGQRATAPQKGLYGGIGGHLEPAEKIRGEPYRIEKPGGSMQPSFIEKMAARTGSEHFMSAAVRECLEEMFNEQEPDVSCVSNLWLIRGIEDVFKSMQYFNVFFLGTINRPASEIKPQPKELTDVRPLVDIPVDQIYPIAQVALEELRRTLPLFMVDPKLKSYLEMNIAAQIPEFDLDAMREFLSTRGTSMQHILVL